MFICIIGYETIIGGTKAGVQGQEFEGETEAEIMAELFFLS